jgi:hypothetical protein
MVAEERPLRARHVHCSSLWSRDDCLISGELAASRLPFQFRNTSATRTAPSKRDAVIKAMQSYIDGVRLGSSTVMRAGFHEAATIFGYYPGGVMAHPIQALFDWIDNNGPSPELKTEFGDIDVRESIASVHLEVRDFSGALAGTGVRMSDTFLLLRTDAGWKITQKVFHWYQ